MTNQPDILVTAIVSVYRAERFLHGCLEDLERQTIASRLEIIIVDSGSPENEGTIARSFQERFDNIRYIRTAERETIYRAWNRAIEASSGKYLTNANADDRHRPDALEVLVNALESNTEAAVAYADSYVTESENETWPPNNSTGIFHWPMFSRDRLFGFCTVGPQPVWRRSLHVKYGPFDDNLRSAGDYEFWLRIAAHATHFIHVPEILGIYLASPSGVELSNQELSNAESATAKHRHWKKEWGSIPPSPPNFLFPSLDDSPLVTVVIASRDRPAMLRDALLSVVAQTYEHWEVVLVNDGGLRVDAAIQEIVPKDRIRLIEHWQSLGQARARNAALSIARGQIICYLDDDDLFLPEHLKGIVEKLRSTGSPFVFSGGFRVTEVLEGKTRHEISRIDIEELISHPQEKLMVWNFVPLPTWGHRRECIKHVGYFEEGMRSHEDWDLILRFSKFWQLVRIDQKSVEIRVRPSANDSVTTRNNAHKLEDFHSIYRRHPTDKPDICAARRRVLSDLGEPSVPTSGNRLRRFVALLKSHISWAS